MTLHDLRDLGGLAEIAQTLKVPEFRVKRWIERRDSTNCPKPLRELKAAHLYSIREWRAWYALWQATRGVG
jgi:hypothetical protein